MVLNVVYSALFAMILSNYLYAAFTDKDYHQAFLFSYRQAIMAFVIHASLSIQKLL
jgi:chromate transport protein ChrA